MAASSARAESQQPKQLAPYDTGAHARKFGIILGVATAIFLIIANLVYKNDVPLSLRFASHLLIIPVVWYAATDYAKRLPEGQIFQSEIGYLLKLAGYAAVTLFALNVLMFMFTGHSFEQFMQEGETFAAVMINSTFLFFETVVFVMVVAFITMQGLKGKSSSPQD